MGHVPVVLLVVDGAARGVDGEVLVVDADTVELGVVVSEEAALKQLVRGEGGQFHLGVVALRVAVELHDSNRDEGKSLWGQTLVGSKALREVRS